VSKTKLMICFSSNALQIEFVEINVVVILIAGNNPNVSVEVQYYLMTNSAAFLAMLAALELKIEK